MRVVERQAENLLKLASSPSLDGDPPVMARSNPNFKTIAVTSGKGGVGKTNLAANLGVVFSQMGKRTIIFDADLGLANVDVFFNLHPRYTLKHVVSGEKEISEILVEGPAGTIVVPASSGVEMMANLPGEQRLRLLGKLSELCGFGDLMVIDTAAGISENVISFAAASDVVLIVATPDPASITDAYATIKLINKRRRRPFKLVVNMARSESQGRDVALSLSLACRRFLGLELDYLGFIPEDPAVNKALRRQVPLVLQYPGSIAARHITAIAGKLLSALERLPCSDFLRALREGMGDEPGA